MQGLRFEFDSSGSGASDQGGRIGGFGFISVTFSRLGSNPGAERRVEVVSGWGRTFVLLGSCYKALGGIRCSVVASLQHLATCNFVSFRV